MPRTRGFAVVLCLCLGLPAVSAARGQGMDSPSRHTAIYTEHYESPEDILRSARSAAGGGPGAAFAQFDGPASGDRGLDDWSAEPVPARTATGPDYLDALRPAPIERRYWEPDELLLPDSPRRPTAPVYVEPWITPTNVKFFATHLPGSGDRLGLSELDVAPTFKFPRVAGLWVTPGMGAVFTDGPSRTDLSPQLYNARLEVGYKHEFAPHMGLSLSVAPGVYSDFERSNGDAFRVVGKAVGFFAFSEQTQAILGVAYLDRDDVPALPIFGIIHAPNENVRLEFLFPQPRFAQRVLEGDHGNGWVYLGGEFGGDAWAVERTSGRKDMVAYSDWRLKFGFEWAAHSGRNLILETGYVFRRRLEYKSGLGDYHPSSTALLRFGLTY